MWTTPSQVRRTTGGANVELQHKKKASYNCKQFSVTTSTLLFMLARHSWASGRRLL